MENVSFCLNNVTKSFDELSGLSKVDCEIYQCWPRKSTILGGLLNKAFSVVITCVEIVFYLVTCVHNKLWLSK